MGKALLMAVTVTVRERLRQEVAVTARASDLPMWGSIACVPQATWDMAWLVLATADVAGKVPGPRERLRWAITLG
jgi:hypothetical protein